MGICFRQSEATWYYGYSVCHVHDLDAGLLGGQALSGVVGG